MAATLIPLVDRSFTTMSHVRCASGRLAVLLLWTSLVMISTEIVLGDDGATPSEGPDPVGLFDAIASRDIDVRVKAHGFSQATLTLRNKTRKVLRVQIPNALAAVPITRARRQAAGGGGAAYGYGGGGGSDSQTLGISAYRPASSSSSSSASGRRSSSDSKADDYRREELAAESISEQVDPKIVELKPGRTIRKKFPSFCLELGRPDPSPRMPYVAIQLDQWTKDAAIHELIVRFGQGYYPQRVTQLAIWRIANRASWETLANVRWPTGGRTTEKQIAAARSAVRAVLEVTKTP